MCGRRAGKFDEALEGVAEVADALEVMTERVRFRAGADDEHVARAHAALESAVEQGAIDEAAQAKGDRDQDHRDEHDAPRNIFGVNQIERAGEQKAGGEADLHAEALLMQEGAQAGRRVEMQPAAGNNQTSGERGEQSQQDPHGAAVKERSIVESACSDDGTCVALVDGGDDRGDKDCEDIKKHPELDFGL